MIIIDYPHSCDYQLVNFENFPVRAERVIQRVMKFLRGYTSFSLYYNGRKLYGSEMIPDDCNIHVLFPLPGGKGGFGSMLRAIGAQIEKTTNREACRDLSGRRLRDINEEQRLKKWIAKEAEREAEKIKRRQARIERLKTKAPHNFFDYEYEKEISELPDRISEALNEGLQKSKHPKKRPLEESGETKLPKKSWLADDLPLSSSDSDLDETSEGSSSKKSRVSFCDNACSSDMSESFEPQPSSSKVCTSNKPCTVTSSTFIEAQSEEQASDSDKVAIREEKDKLISDESSSSSVEMRDISVEESKIDSTVEETHKKSEESEKKYDASISDKITPAKQPEKQDDAPIDLLDFESVSDLEALGLDRLKSALMSRGLKCGGTLSDRAQRLWKVRGLQPQEYPANLLAKSKK